MYKWDAHEYQSSSSNQKNWGIEIALKLDLTGNKRVLDIGCGDGEVTAFIAERLPSGFVQGIDSSQDMISLARDSFPVESYPNLSFLVKDVKELDFYEEFDIVFSNACLHWVINHLPVLEGIKRALKPAGIAMLQMGGKGNAAGVIQVLGSIVEEQSWSEYFVDFLFPYGMYGPEDYSIWLHAYNFKAKRIELLPKDMIHPTQSDFMSWIKTTWLPYTQRIPDPLRESFIESVVEKYVASYPPDSNGNIHVQMTRLEIEAQKQG